MNFRLVHLPTQPTSRASNLVLDRSNGSVAVRRTASGENAGLGLAAQDWLLRVGCINCRIRWYRFDSTGMGGATRNKKAPPKGSFEVAALLKSSVKHFWFPARETGIAPLSRFAR